MKEKRVSELIGVDEIRAWNKGDIITIIAGTGAGKSYFIKNILYAFAKSNNKKILFLIHRSNCKNQFLNEIKKDKKTDIIDIMTYQKIEALILKNGIYDLNEYEYIVSDEFHYFMSDASFNKTTDISLDNILKTKKSIKIFMSATCKDMKRYINDIRNYKTIDYELSISFGHIRRLKFFYKDKTLQALLDECIERDEKGIFFIDSAELAYNLYSRYPDKCLFNCSKSNNRYYKHVNESKIEDMLNNEKFEENALITTTCFDAGVNIIDPELNHIVCDVKDIDSLVQCIGRKRIINDDDYIFLYIKSITNQQLGGLETNYKKRIKKADFLRKHTVEEYIKEFPRSFDYNNIVYDEVTKDNQCTKKINELMYFKCLLTITSIQTIKQYGSFGYNQYFKNLFGLDDYSVIEDEKENAELEYYLESIIGKVMYQIKDRKELIEKIDVKSNGKLLKKINNLNGALEEGKIPYRIIEFSTSKMVDGKQKRYPNSWRIEKLIS